MNQAEQLRSAFQRHEHLAPDAEVVHRGALELARGYRRRRTAGRAAGGAVVVAGIAAGAVVVPGLSGGDRPADPQPGLSFAAPAAPPAPAAAPLAPSPEEQRAAFFDAGYDYDDAVELARLWGVVDGSGTVDEWAAKAEAGRRLLQGEVLPVAPGTAPDVPTPTDQEDMRPYDAFLQAGYDWDDAVVLAQLWQTSDVLQAKAQAGRKLLDGETLPFAP